MSRTIVICLAIALMCMATADASYREKPSMYGTMIRYEICDSLVVLKLSPTASESDLTQLMIQRPELRDDYPSWMISEGFAVVGLTTGTDADIALASLRALPIVALAAPVFQGSGGALYYMTDVVMVSFKAETTSDEIDQLNATLPLISAVPNADGPLQWTVLVAPHSGTDALEVANR